MPVVNVDLDDFGAERGLFKDDPDADRLDGRAWDGTWRRNRDFLRLKDHALHLVSPRPGMRVLDIGCANGAQMVMLGLQGAEVAGQDLDAPAVEAANRKLERLGIDGRASVGDASRLQFDDESFDVVLSSDFHEHFDDALALAINREAWRVLRPGGRYVIKTPNLGYLKVSLAFKRARALTRGVDPRSLVIPHTPGTDDPEHVGLRTRWALARTLEDAGFAELSFSYAPLRRFGRRPVVDVLSTEVPGVRDFLSEDLFCVAHKPIHTAWFPD
jgi:SAM-dependent methyltransferase